MLLGSIFILSLALFVHISAPQAQAALTVGATNITTDGALSIDGVAGSVYTLGPSTTTGTLTIGGTAQTGNLIVGQSSGTNSILIGNGSGAATIALGAGSASSKVGIGTASPANRLSVSGSADISGHLSLGSNASVISGTVVSINEIVTTNTVGAKGSTVDITLNPSSPYPAGVVIGQNSSLRINSGNTQSFASTGLEATATTVHHNGTGTVFYARGIDSYVFNASTGTLGTAQGGIFGVENGDTGTITNGMAGYFWGGNDDTGVFTNFYGVYVDAVYGTIANAYGGYFIAQTEGTNNVGVLIGEATGTKNTNLLIGTTTQPAGSYSIYNASTDQNYFAGNVGIGTASPSELLDINSNNIRIRSAKTPASSSDTCDQGEVAWDASFTYVCVATNTWKRSALSTW